MSSQLYQYPTSLQHVGSVQYRLLVVVMLEGDDQWGPATHLRPDTTDELTGYSLALDSLGRGESEDVDQHDLPPDPQSGPDYVSDNVGQRLHHLAVLVEIIRSVLIIVRVDQPAQGDRGSGYCSSGLSSSPPPQHPSRTPARINNKVEKSKKYFRKELLSFG